MAAPELQPAVQELLAALFRDLGTPADDDVLSYLSAGIAEDPDAESDELADSVAGFSPAFAALPPAKQQALIADLLSRVDGLRRQQQQAAQPPAGTQAPKPSVAALAAQALAQLGGLSVSSSSAASSECGGSDDDGGGALPPQHAAAVATLRELCALPDAADAWLVHVLQSKGGGDVEAAAGWMLEQEDLAAAQRAWQAAKQAAREERARAAAEREADKRRIVSRFQLQAVPNGGSSGSGKGGKPPVQVWGSGGGGGGGENGGKARYRDGALVSQRGEKFIIEKGDEWDGGSRGKVFTKGKRGKGFV